MKLKWSCQEKSSDILHSANRRSGAFGELAVHDLKMGSEIICFYYEGLLATRRDQALNDLLPGPERDALFFNPIVTLVDANDSGSEPQRCNC